MFYLTESQHEKSLQTYFLLQVGEYTQPQFVYRNGKKLRATQTKQFTAGNVSFFRQNKLIPRNSPLSVLLRCNAATLQIINQKNGQFGETIHLEAVTDSKNNPVATLHAQQVHRILSNGGTPGMLLCTYFENGEVYTVKVQDIIKAVCKVTTLLKLQDQAIDPDIVSTHSLTAGRAMAL